MYFQLSFNFTFDEYQECSSLWLDCTFNTRKLKNNIFPSIVSFVKDAINSSAYDNDDILISADHWLSPLAVSSMWRYSVSVTEDVSCLNNSLGVDYANIQSALELSGSAVSRCSSKTPTYCMFSSSCFLGGLK